MDKQKQIEEMTQSVAINGALSCNGKILGMSCGECKYRPCVRYFRAEEVYNEGYRKITDEVVLTEEELHDKGYRKVCEPVIRNGEVVGFVNGADYVPKNLFLFGIANTRKETAEKFAERMKEKFDYDERLCDDVDEICKGIVEGK